MIPDLSMGLQLYENGEVDNIDLTESNLTTITSDPNNEQTSSCARSAPPSSASRLSLIHI